MHGRGDVHGRVCVCGRGCAWWGHAWQGGVHGRGACVAGACMARGACVVGGHAWQILRDTVNEWAVLILLECILVVTVDSYKCPGRL